MLEKIKDVFIGLVSIAFGVLFSVMFFREILVGAPVENFTVGSSLVVGCIGLIIIIGLSFFTYVVLNFLLYICLEVYSLFSKVIFKNNLEIFLDNVMFFGIILLILIGLVVLSFLTGEFLIWMR